MGEGEVERKVMEHQAGLERLVAFVSRIHSIEAKVDPLEVTREQVEAQLTRCPDAEASEEMVQRIDEARKRGDSLGGVVTCVAQGVPPGLGEPVFDKLEAELAKGLLSLPACKGFEIGSGFAGTRLTGIEHNDPFFVEEGRVRTRTGTAACARAPRGPAPAARRRGAGPARARPGSASPPRAPARSGEPCAPCHPCPGR